MPSATSRRRTNPRAQSSDIEDGPTQRSAREDVDEDDEEPQRVVKKEKNKAAAKGKGKARASEAQPDEDDDEDDDDDDRIDVDNFTNQPLIKADVSKMRGLATDWAAMVKTIQRTNTMVAEVAVALADNAESGDGRKGLSELERLLKDLIDVESEMQINQDVIENLSQQVASGDAIENIVEKYHENVQTDKDSYAAKTTRQKYAKSETYKNFKQSIYEIDNPGQAMPPVTEFIPKESGDDSDDDDDLEVGAVTQDFKCPLSLRPLENPLTSQVCGHSFSAESIRAMFGNDKGLKKCPSSGCAQSFRLSDCKQNKELAKKMKLHERRMKKKEQEMDAEEVIE
ncbi:hypothetical protein BT96DRAFT_964324 [Gymnopus androsaceus JB14]|uniref:SP-RING-type domain-containing protein n=1 Tax=Gymnopus androsaceus JB14 TaxID=1447944 RepID=A0A6A4HXC5_9AGAR|nr:hypothetical protein BT96DRAFT_964324 [Gymnopus androsaceus JB14]